MQLPTNHTASILDAFLYQSIADCIDFELLCHLERRLAFAIGRIDGTTDEQMLAWPRELIASALRVLADRYVNGQPDDVEDLELRYSNAICRDVDPLIGCGGVTSAGR